MIFGLVQSGATGWISTPFPSSYLVIYEVGYLEIEQQFYQLLQLTTNQLVWKIGEVNVTLASSWSAVILQTATGDFDANGRSDLAVIVEGVITPEIRIFWNITDPIPSPVTTVTPSDYLRSLQVVNGSLLMQFDTGLINSFTGIAWCLGSIEAIGVDHNQLFLRTGGAFYRLVEPNITMMINGCVSDLGPRRDQIIWSCDNQTVVYKDGVWKNINITTTTALMRGRRLDIGNSRVTLESQTIFTEAVTQIWLYGSNFIVGQSGIYHLITNYTCPGNYYVNQSNPACLLCPQLMIYDDLSEVCHCPSGMGLSDLTGQCQMCPSGTISLQDRCIISAFPDTQGVNIVPKTVAIAPATVQDQSQIQVIALSSSLSLIIALLIAGAIIWLCLRKNKSHNFLTCVRAMDVCFASNHYVKVMPGPIIKRKTFIGGLFSLLAVVLIIIAAIILIIRYQTNNTRTETTTPILEQYPQPNLDIVIKVTGELGLCNNIVISKGIGSETAISLMPRGQECLVHWNCLECQFTNGRSTVEVLFTDSAARAWDIQYNVSSNQNVVSGRRLSPPQTFFQGPDPTVVNLRLKERVVVNDIDKTEIVTYPLNYVNDQLGTIRNSSVKLFTSEGVSIVFDFTIDLSTYERIEISQRDTILTFAAFMISAIVAIFGGIRIILIFTETTIRETKKKWRARKTNDVELQTPNTNSSETIRETPVEPQT